MGLPTVGAGVISDSAACLWETTGLPCLAIGEECLDLLQLDMPRLGDIHRRVPFSVEKWKRRG